MDIELPQGITAVDEHGLAGWRVRTPLCTGLVLAQGALVAQWAPHGQQEVLWLAEHAQPRPGRAPRGGVPVCFPWFGPGREGNRTPAHGFARTSTWRLVEADVDARGAARLVLELTGDEVADLGGFPADFTVRHTVVMGDALEMELAVQAGAEPLEVEEALHSYLAVGDVRRVRLEGLDRAPYWDKVRDEEGVQQGTVEFTTETDRVYRHEGDAVLLDPVLGRRTTISKQGSAATVVWNPWADETVAIPDMGDDEWAAMCCVETANCLASTVCVAPGSSHAMRARICVAPL